MRCKVKTTFIQEQANRQRLYEIWGWMYELGLLQLLSECCNARAKAELPTSCLVARANSTTSKS